MTDKTISKNPVMNPLILQYTEKFKNENFDLSQIAYSSELNLTIYTKTGLPAIDLLNMSTETHTRTYNESSDCDSENMGLMMGTLTHTSYQIEGSDNDSSFNAFKSMIGTNTFTFISQESTDND
ncbi:hypothetical protein [Flavobacterium hydatis]|jgi:hypothetical protein|uniref:Uncharacterized protein n=1 Tax=Flavobacterium hydatis TaxID=991 RepID=A0A086AIK4_FLAHY|nr:hypothetical protein [Flavobacterium hydatis]KFF16518.1 hypothetical protein IW20_10110 [Flavobacterium hydatis]OXA93915.1 hypothetical protein B0A62_12235 [Flavobacterium hydatis]